MIGGATGSSCEAYLFTLESRKHGPGFFAGVCNTDQAQPWRGVELWQSPEPRSGFRSFCRIDEQCISGVVREPMVPGYFRSGKVDRHSSICVEVSSALAPLESVSRDALRGGRNTFLCGMEVVQVMTWEFTHQSSTGDNVYRGTNIARGLQGTGKNGLDHYVGERLIWLDHGGMEFVKVPQHLHGGPRYWRAVPAGGSLARARSQAILRIPSQPRRYVQAAGAMLYGTLGLKP